MMSALTEYWTALDTRRRAMLVGGAAALLVVLVMLTRLVATPSYALLYSGLDPAAAGDVIAAIEARGIAHRVEGDSIHVDAAQRDTLRMALAAEGLPANGAAGYELLDTLSGFGTTSQMFDAAYWRAKEGELARTILTSPRIRAARVHIANPSADPFQPVQDVTASVAIRPAAGGLAPGHAQALRYLVASSVPGLLPERVAVIDADSGQVLGGAESGSAASDAMSRAEQMRRNIERLLAARVGHGNAVVEVSVTLNSARETIRERRIDPESRVVIATESEERDNSERGGGAAGVTVASNLPEGDAAGDGDSMAQASETRERITFDLSELQREVERAPGDVERITVAVLLNGIETVGDDGVIRVVPRPAEEIAALRTLVESAIGFDAERGDIVTLESLAFDEAIMAELAPARLTDRVSLDLGRVLQTVVLALAALFIVFGLLRPLLRGAPVGADAGTDIAMTPALAESDPIATTRLAAPQSLPETAPMHLSAPAAPSDTGNLPALASAEPLPTSDPDGESGRTAGTEDPVERLRRLIEEREEETIEILRSWIDEEEAQT